MLIDTIKADLLKARTDKKYKITALLGVLIGETENQAKRQRQVMDDGMLMATCRKIIKNNLEVIKVSNGEKDEALLAENTLFEAYLPKQMSDEDICGVISHLDLDNVGAIMRHLKDNYGGQYDGRLASRIAAE